MKPGRELDALVAEKVMGLKRSYRKGETIALSAGTTTWIEGDLAVEITGYPRYSTDISAAWGVVEAKDARLLLFQMSRVKEHPIWKAEFVVTNLFRSDDRFTAEASTAPHAICLAALKAVGVEI